MADRSPNFWLLTCFFFTIFPCIFYDLCDCWLIVLLIAFFASFILGKSFENIWRLIELFCGSEKLYEVINRSSRPKVFLGKVVCNFIEIALRHRCPLVNWLHIFRTPFRKRTSGQLLWIKKRTNSTRIWLRHFSDMA